MEKKLNKHNIYSTILIKIFNNIIIFYIDIKKLNINCFYFLMNSYINKFLIKLKNI